MTMETKSLKSKTFTRNEPSGTPSDINKGITSRLDVYNLVTGILKETKSMPFEIDFLQVHKVFDTKQDIVSDISKFGMVTGKFIYSGGNKVDTSVRCFPIDVDNFELPIPGEVVIVVRYHDKNYYFDKLTVDGASSNYDQALHYRMLRPDVIEAIENEIEGYGAPKAPKKRPFVEQGGKVIASRYGSSILFDHSEAKPVIRLSNNHSQEGSVPYFESRFTKEGSTISLDSTRSKDFPLPVVTNVMNMRNGSNDKVIINSDQLIFQSREKPIHMNSGGEIYINAPTVHINNEPAVLGKVLTKVLKQILDLMGTMIKGISASQGSVALNPARAKKELTQLYSILEDFWASPTGVHNIIALDPKGKNILKAADIREV